MQIICFFVFRRHFIPYTSVKQLEKSASENMRPFARLRAVQTPSLGAGRFIFAGVDPNTPAGKWQQERQTQGRPGPAAIHEGCAANLSKDLIGLL